MPAVPRRPPMTDHLSPRQELGAIIRSRGRAGTPVRTLVHSISDDQLKAVAGGNPVTRLTGNGNDVAGCQLQ